MMSGDFENLIDCDLIYYSEGALAQNLVIQFADKAVGVLELSEELFKHGMTDVRYMRLWQEMMNEVGH